MSSLNPPMTQKEFVLITTVRKLVAGGAGQGMATISVLRILDKMDDTEIWEIESGRKKFPEIDPSDIQQIMNGL